MKNAEIYLQKKNAIVNNNTQNNFSENFTTNQLYQLRELKGYLSVIEEPFDKKKCEDYRHQVKFQAGAVILPGTDENLKDSNDFSDESSDGFNELPESAEVVLSLLDKWCK